MADQRILGCVKKGRTSPFFSCFCRRKVLIALWQRRERGEARRKEEEEEEEEEEDGKKEET